MEKFKEVLETVLTNIAVLIDFTFVILESPYLLIMSIFISYEKCDIIYFWVPICGVGSVRINYLAGKFESSIDGHILIRKLFKK